MSTCDLTIDFETRSDIELRGSGSRGVHNYMSSPNTRALMASYKLNGGPKKRWRYGEPCPADIREHVEAGGMISAQNAAFERLLWQLVLTPRYGWPAAKTEQFRCTAATAAAMALPRDLEKLGAALDLKVQKDKEGKRLIQKFSKPRKARKGEEPGLYWNELEDHPEDAVLFHDYCDVDVETESEADSRMMPLSDEEQELYVIDQRINDRGIRIDRRSVRAAIRLAAKATALLDAEMAKTTNGAVTACTQVKQLTEWVHGLGVPIPSLAKADIEDILETNDLPAIVRRALEIRQEAAKTSVAKLHTFLKRVSADGRIRHSFLYHAASTGRWSSVGAQLHNLPRPRKEFGDAHPDLAILFWAFRLEDPDFLKFFYGDKLGRTLHLLADAVRGFLWAAPNHDLLVADYSGIEGAVAAWFAGEDWKVEAMHELIANPDLPDMYRRSAAGIYNTTTELLTKKDPRRQVGKVSELSLQYQGGVGAFISMARGYSLKIEPIFEPVWAAASEERRERAEKRYEQCLKRGEATTQKLSRKAWLAAELVKIGWRATHPAICNTWSALEEGIREAILNPGQRVTVLKVQYLVARGFLWCRLPSGRCLAYAKPRLRDQVWAKRVDMDTLKWNESSEVMLRDEAERLVAKGLAKIEGEAKPAATALGVNSVTKRWERFALYGGLAFENIVQAIARDILAIGIKKAEAAGYPVIGHVHDEIICEVPRGWGDVGEFEKMICDLPEVYRGLPLTASGWRGKRYRKD